MSLRKILDKESDEIYTLYGDLVDTEIINLFDKYEYLLTDIIGIELNDNILEAIALCNFGLEDAFIAFCSWALYKKKQGKELKQNALKKTLIAAIHERWQPKYYQQEHLKSYEHFLKSKREIIWDKAEVILGKQLRSQIVSDITKDGKLQLYPSTQLSEDEKVKLTELIKELS